MHALDRVTFGIFDVETINLKAMKMLNEAHVARFGRAVPTEVETGKDPAEVLFGHPEPVPRLEGAAVGLNSEPGPPATAFQDDNALRGGSRRHRPTGGPAQPGRHQKVGRGGPKAAGGAKKA